MEATSQPTARDPINFESSDELERLFRDHSARIYRIAYRVTGNTGDAEDVLQTIFLRLLRREERPELRGSGASYFHRAAVNAGLDLLRSKQRKRAIPLGGVNGLSGLNGEDDAQRELVETHPSAEATSRVERSEIRFRLRQALAGLNPRAAEVFSLRYFEGYGNTEIAEMLGTSRSAVGVTLHRSRERLKEELRSLVGAPA